MIQLGEYLIENGVITEEQLHKALMWQRKVMKNTSLMALAEGFLTQNEIEQIFARQIENKEDFEEALLALKILSPKRLNELKELREEFRVPLGQILRNQGFITGEQQRFWIDEYEKLPDEHEGLFELFSKIDCFKSLDDSLIKELTALSTFKHYDPGDTIYKEGAPGDAVYIINTGLVRLSIGEEEKLLDVGLFQSGDYFGFSALIGNEVRMERAQAMTKTEVCRIYISELQDLLKQNADAATVIAKVVNKEIYSILQGFKFKKPVYQSNVFSIIFEAGFEKIDIVKNILSQLYSEQDGDIQVIHNNPNLKLPSIVTSSFFSGVESFHETQDKIFTLEIKQLNIKDDYQRVLQWLHEESKLIGTILFLIFSSKDTGVSVSTKEGKEMVELILENSRRSIILTPGTIPQYKECLRKDRDRIYLIHSDDNQKNINNYSSLKAVRGDCLATVTFKLKNILISARVITRFLLRKEIGFVFGGGGAKTAAQTGVLEVFEKEGIVPDVTAGSSSGAITAAFYSYGYSISEIQEIFVNNMVKRKYKFPDWTIPFKGSLAKGKTMERFLRDYFGDSMTFDCIFPFFPVAANMTNGQEIVVKGCEIWKAALGTQCIPGLLPLVKYDDVLIGDGAMVNNIPSSVLHNYGANFIISINISPTPDKTSFNPQSLGSNIMRSAEVMMFQTTSLHTQYTDLEIRPEVGLYHLNDFSNSELFVDLGRKAAEEKLPELRYLLKNSTVR